MNFDNDDLVWSTLMDNLPNNRKLSATQFVNVNCPMCTSRGETQDKRMRCGVKRDYDGIVVSCWNCGFVSKWQPGNFMSNSFRLFLETLGVGPLTIKRINLKSMMMKKIAGEVIEHNYTYNYHEVELPEKSKTISEWAEDNCIDKNYIDVVNYLFSRGEELSDPNKFYWSPQFQVKRRLIIPFYNGSKIVGWTARTIDNDLPKYWNSSVPEGYLFNVNTLFLKRKYTIIVEGPFDALALDTIGTLGGKISDSQINRIKLSGQLPILLADRDRTGSRVIDIAYKNNWMIAFPKLKNGSGNNNWWEADVKDAAEAVSRYGRWYTLQSVMATATSNKLEINIKKRLLYT